MDRDAEFVHPRVGDEPVVEAEEGLPSKKGTEREENLRGHGNLTCCRERWERNIPDMAIPHIFLISQNNNDGEANCKDLETESLEKRSQTERQQRTTDKNCIPLR